jgi:hypothetical protein
MGETFFMEIQTHERFTPPLTSLPVFKTGTFNRPTTSHLPAALRPGWTIAAAPVGLWGAPHGYPSNLQIFSRSKDVALQP